MPILKEYYAPDASRTVDVQAGEAGQRAVSQAGRFTEERARATGAALAQGIGSIGAGISHVGEAVGKIVENHLYQQNMIQQDASLAKMQSDYLESYKQAAKTWDPNDLSAPKQFMQDNWTPKLDQYMRGFYNGRARERGVQMWNAANEHMTNMMISDTSERGGAAAIINTHQAIDGYIKMVTADPSAIGHTLQQLDNTFNGIKGGSALDAKGAAAIEEERIPAKQKVEMAALTSLLAMPNGAGNAAAQTFVTKGWLPDIGPEGQKLVTTAVRVQQDQARSNAFLAEMQKRDAEQTAAVKTMKELFPIVNGHIQADPNSDVMATVLKHADELGPQLGPALRLGMDIKNLQATDANTTTNQTTKDDLIAGMALPPSDPKFTSPLQIYKAAVNKQLSRQDLDFLIHMSDAAEHDPQIATALKTVASDNPVIQAGLDGAKQRLIGASGAAAGNAVSGFNPAILAASDKFKADTMRLLQMAAMQKQDLTQYLDPTSKLYVFSQDRIDQYRPTKDELGSRLLAKPAVPGATPAAKPDLGEIIRKALTFPVKPGEQTHQPGQSMPEGDH